MKKGTNNSYHFSVNMLNVHFVTFRIDLVTLSLSMFSFVWFGYRPREGWEQLELCLRHFLQVNLHN